jgi:hypothetical protein
MFRRFSFVALMAALVVAAPAVAADATFTVSGIHIDASAASATEARNAATAAGRVQAWQVLFRRITRQQDWAKQPNLDPAALEKLISSYFPLGERRSTTRYVADVTYIFNPEAVARLLQSSGIAYTSAQAKRVLVIPMAPGFSRGSAWTQALANPRFAGGMVPFVVPLGDPQDMKYLAGLPFDTSTWANVEPVAARLHASEAVLILVAVNGRKMVITLRRIGPGQVPVKAAAEVPMQQGAPATYASAADIALHAMEDMWKTRTAVDFAQKGKLTVEANTPTLEHLVAMENTLAAVPNVSNVTVVAIDIGAARLELSYLGGIEQLRDALRQSGLSLARTADGGWQLSQIPGAP